MKNHAFGSDIGIFFPLRSIGLNLLRQIDFIGLDDPNQFFLMYRPGFRCVAILGTVWLLALVSSHFMYPTIYGYKLMNDWRCLWISQGSIA